MKVNPTLVVMGIIDDGIAFAQEQFRLGSKTRVEYWWLQDGAPLGSVPYGRELNKAQINALFAQCTRAGVIDEDEVYRGAGLIDFRQRGHKSAAWRIAHGTHVLDLACGYDPQIMRDDRPIVCVQLPIRVTADTSGGTLGPHALVAMQYILERADQIAKDLGTGPLPVVVNLSYGYFAGPHDGTTPFEVAMDDLVQKSAKRDVTLRIVLPAGNSYLLRTHAQTAFPNVGDSACLDWRILPDGRKPSYLEIWLPTSVAGAPSRLAVSITSPTGQQMVIQEQNGALQQWVTPAGAVYAEVRYHYRASSQRGLFFVVVNETMSLQQGAAIAPAGTWIVKLQNQALGPGDVVHAWVQRDDSLYGFPIRGRQSYFNNGYYQRFDPEGRDNETDDPACVVLRAATLNAIATGQEPIVMGGFLRKEMVAAKYSSSGPVANPPRPDAMTVSEDSKVHAGVLAAGSRSGSVIAMGGTSVAAPQIARLIADDLAAGGKGDRAAVQERAMADEATYPAGTPPPPPAPPPTFLQRYGAGRIMLPPHVRMRRYWGQY